jgi:hypothetical protein
VERERSLYTTPPMHAFKRGEEDKLERLLDRMERATSAHPITDIEELQLAKDGTTKRGGFRYTSAGFKQVTQTICPGASTMLADISGTTKRPSLKENMYSPHESQRMFNQLLDMRGDLLINHRMIRNEDDKLLEGFMGAKHRALGNLDSYHQMRDAVEAMSPDAKLHAAMLIGRRLLLWYRKDKALFAVKTTKHTVSFFPGYYFSNAEATGTSVSGTSALFTRYGICLRPFKKHERVTHIGRDFNRRLSKMFRSVLEEDEHEDGLRVRCTELIDTPLGYAGLDKKERKTRDRRIVQGLGRLGVQQRLAQSILEQALLLGSDDASEPPPAYDMHNVLGSRTLYDLFAALLQVARKLPINRREKVEQAAYRVLIGRLEI